MISKTEGNKMNLKMTKILMVVSMIGATSAHAFDLKSTDLKAGGTIPQEFVFNGMGCTGGNASPELHWTGAPKGTKSFAITVYDPDAPTGSGFWHWVAYGLSADTTSIAKSWKPDAKSGVTEVSNDYGAAGFGGPCPPPGKPHHYIFTVYALKTDKLEIPAGATNAVARFVMMGSVLGKASFTALYGR
jgi:Raf kinase inhibitor-like YbhB/YbcL family protein